MGADHQEGRAIRRLISAAPGGSGIKTALTGAPFLRGHAVFPGDFPYSFWNEVNEEIIVSLHIATDYPVRLAVLTTVVIMSALRTFCHYLIAAAALLSAFAVQAAEPLRVDTGSALTALVKHFHWLEAAGLQVQWVQPGERADFTVASGRDALAVRADGAPVKAVYVLSGAAAGAADAQFLLVSEALLAARGHDARVVLAALERVRQWVNAQPDAAAQIAGAALQGRSFAGSRPGPAQLAALKALARERGVDEQLGAALLDDTAYRAALNAMQTAALDRSLDR